MPTYHLRCIDQIRHHCEEDIKVQLEIEGLSDDQLEAIEQGLPFASTRHKSTPAACSWIQRNALLSTSTATWSTTSISRQYAMPAVQSTRPVNCVLIRFHVHDA